MVSTHSRPKAAGTGFLNRIAFGVVSTHSRPKAAGKVDNKYELIFKFQLTAARRRLALCSAGALLYSCVSTHSRPKAAGLINFMVDVGLDVSTHSRPKAAGRGSQGCAACSLVSTHSRPKAAGYVYAENDRLTWFQLTAARRRLEKTMAHRRKL